MEETRKTVSLKGVGLAAAWLSLALGCAPEPLDANLLLISLDTTRLDHLGAYGYGRDTSPHLDALAAEGVVYTQAYSTSSWTLPAHASLFTGKFPTSHGAHMDARGSLVLSDALGGDPGLRHYRASPLAPGEPTLAGILAGRGFATGGVVAGPWLKRVFGLDRGFAHWDDAGITSVGGRPAAQVTDAALAWLDEVADQRFFLFLNYFDPHFPYADPEGHAQRYLPPGTPWPVSDPTPSLPVGHALYDGEIRYMDDQIGRLFEGLRERRLYDDTWIIVTADHGELLGEHARTGHGKTLFQEELRIPLIMKYPSGASVTGTDDEPVQLTDVFTRVLERYGLEAPAAARGAPAAIFAEVYRPASVGGEGDWRVLLEGGKKFHWNSRGQHLLFDLEADPGEEHSLATDRAQVEKWKRRLADYLARLPPAPGPAQPEPVDTDTREALESLGYLE